MAVLSRIIETIDRSTIDCIAMATKIGFDQSTIQQIENSIEPTKEFVICLTTRMWEDIFNYFKVNCNISNNNENIPGIVKLANMLLKEEDCTSYSGEPIEERSENSQDIDIVHEISMIVADWKAFARVLGFSEPSISDFEKIIEPSLTDDIFKRNSQRNKYLMNEALKILNEKNVKTDSTSWIFWRNYLHQFHNGKEVIKEMERYFPKFLAQSPIDQVHETVSSKMIFIGHPLQHELFHIDKSNSEIPVNIGCNKFQFLHLQQHIDWLETQERYMDVFNLFKDKVVFNFHDLEEYCPILNTLEDFINATGGNGFATKGYHLVNHLKLFDQCKINNESYENFFCFLEKHNIALNFTRCRKEPGHALYYSSQNIQIMNALHNELQLNDIVQVNVLIHNEDDSVDFCRRCIENNLYIKEDVLTDIWKFKSWFIKLQKIVHGLKRRIPTSSSNRYVLQDIKQDMITYEALENADAFPTFSNLPEDQINELPKIIFLTGAQFTILHTNDRHIILRGPYGSGKSIVLKRKLDKCIESMNDEDIVYYICHDQQSKFNYFMKFMGKEYQNKLMVICHSKNLRFGRQKPTLSIILNHILQFWKGKRVHIFIDELCGSYITGKEISELRVILRHFSKSNIVIAIQSMEEHVYEDMAKEIDLGYKYDLLERNTSFVVFNLDYSLRCSAEINEFARVSSEFIEQKEVSLRKKATFYYHGKSVFVDNEYGQEKNVYKNEKSDIKTTFSYSMSDKYGHSASNGPVHLYVYDKFKASTQRKLQIFSKADHNHFDIAQLYFVALDYILLHISGDQKFVICTYDEQLFNNVYYYLKNMGSCVWTSEIKLFVEPKSQFNILLTDYASVRGYEFANFVFLLRMGTKYLKYRMIECFTRATTKLHIITDNMNVSDKSSLDNQLIETWKSLRCVEYFDCKYDEPKDELQILQDGVVKYLKNHINSISIGVVDKFLWRDLEEIEERNKDIMKSVDLHRTIYYLCQNDNIGVVCEFFKVNQLSILEYRSHHLNKSLLHVCSCSGSVNMTKYLLSECQMDIELYDDRNQTPLHHAARFGRTEVVKHLIDNRANIDATNIDGQTPLHKAAQYGHFDVVRLLIDNKANLDLRNKNGHTPLHLAAIGGYVKVIELFINNEANIFAKNYLNKTPLDLAFQWNRHEAVELLSNFQTRFSFCN